MDRFLRNNNALRILALVLACILWLAVHAPASTPSNQVAGVTQTYPLSVHVETSSDVVVSSISSSTATVHVTSNIIRLATLPADMLKVQLVANAQGLGPGTQTLHVAAIDMPNDVKSYSVTPDLVTVVLERKDTEQRPVDLQIEGNPQSGYSLGDFQPGTDAVNVSGAKSAVARVARVIGNVDITGLSDTTTKVISLTPVDSKGDTVQNVTIAPASLSVTVPIVASTEQVALVPEVTGTPAPGYAVSGVTLDTKQVSEIGLAAKDLPKTGLQVPVDVSNLSNSTTVTASVPLLQGMTSVTPDTVTASVQIEPSATVTLSQLPVSVQNAPSGTKVALVNNPKVDVTLSGPESVIHGLSAKQVQVYVDASTLKPGDTTANITVRVPNWVNVSDISLRTVPVQVS